MEKQQNVVFFIGAGFSVPFGLPVMSNFIDKAKDLYFSDRAKYEKIGKTLALIQEFSYVKNYMIIDLHNIEDLLSIAYMESLIKENTKLLNSINDFIKIVIESYTEETKNGLLWFSKIVSNNWFENGSYLRQVHQQNKSLEYHDLVYRGKKFNNTTYGIVSLNYDLLIENALQELSDDVGRYYILGHEENIINKYYMPTKKANDIGIPYAKLHGSIDKSIVPPTWNKNINKDIQEDWILANTLLSEATHIVFLGYSLPSTDNYIKYLLASSLNNNSRLKKISVITKDSDGLTQKRYNNLFTSRIVFHNTDITYFFSLLEECEKGIDFDIFDDYFNEFYNGNK